MPFEPVYVPILKGKEGEFAALEVLGNDVRDDIAPLIEVPGIPYDYARDRNSKTLDEHVAGIAERLQRCWGSDRLLFLDLPWFGEEQHLTTGELAFQSVLGDCAKINLRAVPVVYRTSSPAHLEAAGSHATSCGTGASIRLVVEDFGESFDPSIEVDRMRSGMGQNSLTNLDLILDLEDLGASRDRALLVARYIFSLIPERQAWRRIILAGASFPEDLSDVDASTISTIPRQEWELWQTIQRKPKLLPREDLIFGDYGISHPTPKELDPRTMRMSASIRYTTKADWLIVKGRNVRQYGFEQFFELCKELVKHPEFAGKDYSWGDTFIHQCAKEEAGPGNATTWRKVGTNHHVTLLTRTLKH